MYRHMTTVCILIENNLYFVCKMRRDTLNSEFGIAGRSGAGRPMERYRRGLVKVVVRNYGDTMEVGERVRVKHGDFTEEVGESRCQGEAARGTKEGEIECRPT